MIRFGGAHVSTMMEVTTVHQLWANWKDEVGVFWVFGVLTLKSGPSILYAMTRGADGRWVAIDRLGREDLEHERLQQVLGTALQLNFRDGMIAEGWVTSFDPPFPTKQQTLEKWEISNARLGPVILEALRLKVPAKVERPWKINEVTSLNHLRHGHGLSVEELAGQKRWEPERVHPKTHFLLFRVI